MFSIPKNKGLSIFCALIFLFWSCSRQNKLAPELNRIADDQFTEFVSTYTSGKVSSQSKVTIQLAKPVEAKDQKTSVISLSPAVQGSVKWLTSRVIEFTPKTPLINGENYTAKLNLKSLNIEGAPDQFSFQFEVIEQDFDLRLIGLKSDDQDEMRQQLFQGELVTADIADTAAIESALTFKQGRKALEVIWDFDESASRTHRFQVSGIERQEEESQLNYTFNGVKIGVGRAERDRIIIPALNDFKVLESRILKGDDPHVLLSFSDPLDEDQDLNGLITLEGDSEFRYAIQSNQVKVYTSSGLSGTKRLQVFSGIKNKLSYGMKEAYTANLSFAQEKPQIRISSSGTILPSTSGLVFPFEAVNLKAVDVTVIQVFEKNMVQFLQTNNLNGNDQLRRVGRPVFQGQIELDASGVMDLTKWNSFTLDLQNLIQTEPGSLYQLRMGMQRAYAIYDCGDDVNELELVAPDIEDDWVAADGEGVGAYDSYYSYNYNYSWRDRDNPCTDSYYLNQERTVKTNLLASDLGVIAKIGNDRKLDAFITDLKSTQPLSGVEVDVLDYQQQVIESLETDQEGSIQTDLIRKPYLLVAKRGLERGYLKLWDNRSLSVSNFNVGGARIQKGLKGFIYGERGVWRPGDLIYLNFILEDKDNTLPLNHPVSIELIDPSGNVKSKQVRTQSIGGFYHFPLRTSDTDPTGNWLAKVKVGGTEFNKQIKIETVKPNRLKINLDFKKEAIKVADGPLIGALNVKWLTGAPARNLKAEFDLSLYPTSTKFKGFENYVFDDQAKDFSSERERVFSGQIDNSGYAKVNVALNKQTKAPGKLMATFNGKVFEPGGDFSIDQFSIPFYPYTTFVGIKTPEGDKRGQLLTNEEHKIEVATVDADGKPVSRNDLVLEAFKLNWRWWWDRSNDNLSYYISRNAAVPTFKKTLSTLNGKATASLKIPNDGWGRYYIRVLDPKSGHSAGKVTYFDWPGWVGANRPGAEALLDFSSDRESYEVGERAKVSIPSSGEGRALISIENGTKVIDSYWVELTQGRNEFSFEVTEEMVPNVYIHATLIQPHAQTKNDLPIRLYGIVPISVTNQNSVLKPSLDISDVLEPESEVSLSVTEANGKPMTYTIAVVDEGLLDLTRFQTPNPWNSLFARQALGVKTWDVYDDVIGAFNGDLSRLLAVGGDGSANQAKNTKANRFKPVVVHLGPFELNAGQTANHSFQMPNYVGSVRTMVVAGNQDGAFGKTEKATPVRKPVMVLGTLPRVIGPGESLKLPVTVFALEEKVKDVEVTVNTNDLLRSNSATKKTIQFSEIGDQVVDFDFEVTDKIGIAKVEIIAKSGNEEARYTLEVQVRNPNPLITEVESFVLKEGESLDQVFDQIGMAGTNAMTVELSSLPPINLQKRLTYLTSYPHGCIEQTTSAAFPQLFLSDVIELSSEQQNRTQENVKSAIDRISTFQTSLGGFAYWPGQSDDNAWGTNYAGHFLIEAKDQGYYVPDNLLSNWKKYQRQQARRWSRFGRYNDDIVQAYRLYTLAKAQVPELGAMNRLREDQGLSLEAKWRLAAAYAISGKPQIAKELINRLPIETAAKSTYYYYGSRIRDNAMILETLGLLQMQTEGLNLLRFIANNLSEDIWMSTQTTAYALLGVLKFAQQGEGFNGIDVSLKLGRAARQNINTSKSILLTKANVDEDEPSAVSVSNKNSGVLFVRIIKEGQPLTGEEKASQQGLRLTVNYFDRNGNVLDPSQLSQGDDFTTEVTVYNNGARGAYKDLALTQIFPSGWEILNDRLNAVPGSSTSSNATYKDIRDDRVMTYFDLKVGQRKTFKTRLNSTYAGKYYLPAVEVEAMYDATINGRTKGQWVEIKRVEK